MIDKKELIRNAFDDYRDDWYIDTKNKHGYYRVFNEGQLNEIIATIKSFDCFVNQYISLEVVEDSFMANIYYEIKGDE